MKKTLFTGFMVIALAAVPARCQDILEKYVEEGLKNNLALQQKQLSYRKSLASLKKAKSMFFPDISFNARYTVAEGGRLIEFPVGDLLNPVYNTLNQLTMSDRFTEIENEEFRFYRPTEHETKLSLVQPVFNPDIYFNHRIRKNMTGVREADYKTYRSSLVAEIKKAYFNYMKALELKELVERTRLLLEENLRVNRKLFENDKATIDAVYRSEAELSKLDGKLAEAVKGLQAASAWFNFLLDRPLEEEIRVQENFRPDTAITVLSEATAMAVERRHELDMMEKSRRVAGEKIRLNRSDALPSLFASVDYGYQGRHYRFTGEDDFLLASLVLRWKLFNGFHNRAEVQEARIEQAILAEQQKELENRIRMEVINAWYELMAREARVASSREELTSMRTAFRVVNKKYRQGQASLLEYMDARNAMTGAETDLIVNHYQYHIQYAEFERVSGMNDPGEEPD